MRCIHKFLILLLKNYYGTGGDLNVDEIHEVIPITESCGVWHPQEGVLTGHYNPTEPQKIKKIGQLRNGVVKVIENPNFSPDVKRKFTIADMITGYGVAESVKHYYKVYGGKLEGKRVIVQGWGNVGSSAAYFLAKDGASIVGIIDREGGLIKEDGFSFEEIRQLFLHKEGNKLINQDMLSFEEVNSKIWDVKSEVFLPCAASRLITQDQTDRMIKAGLDVVSAGANVPFADPEIFFGPIADYTDNHVSVIPDFISNCGMARVFGYLMQDNIELTDEAIFSDTSNTILQAIERTYQTKNSKTGIAKTAFELALKQLL